MQGKNKTKAQPQGEIKGSRYYANLKQAQEDIKTQLKFEKLISQLSSEFIN